MENSESPTVATDLSASGHVHNGDYPDCCHGERGTEATSDDKCSIDAERGGCMPICPEHECDGKACKCPESGKATKATLEERLRKECRYQDALNVLCGPDAPHPYCQPCEAAAKIDILQAFEKRILAFRDSLRLNSIDEDGTRYPYMLCGDDADVLEDLEAAINGK